ncbi:G protein-activated inward rectifier potassium channel 3-like isoform X2 [Onthophagus taurus]|uniref:G protein-activated inward rectifier potassium channel 3-like isoform X2 n=1 Tax=Onthophagus taurus TaxID=166361 RepID=UPI0039BE6DCC
MNQSKDTPPQEIIQTRDPPLSLQQKRSIFAKMLQRSLTSESSSSSNQSGGKEIEQKLSPVPQKLFFKPGVIDEEEDGFSSRAESPLMFRASQYIITAPSVQIGLNRTSTCGSNLSHAGSKQDSTRRARPGVQPRVKKRAILKNGECNILQSRIKKRRLKFLQDIFTTLVDAQWRWTLIIFALSFLLSWLGFAVIWWLIAFTHGDFEELHLPENQNASGWTPCVSALNSFTSCFLFSIETQHTIGYGGRATTEECPEAIFVMCLQSIAGVMIQAFMVGIVFAKMTRPKHRTQTLLFSRNAVICQRDGYLCLMFRVGDMRKSHIIGASIRAQLIRPKTTKEGENLQQYQTELSVSADGCDGDLFFIWPMTIVHKIDEDSPLYTLSPRNFLNEQFEIVVILEGTIESTGQTTQARSSYIANEVLWGHRFEPVVSYSKDRRGYEVNYSKFDNVIEVDTPLCSGYELANICMSTMDPIDTISLQRTPSEIQTPEDNPV